MKEIYRIEHRETGVGPFQTNDPWIQTFLVKRLMDNKHYFPSPGDDGLGLGNIPHWFVFGCPTIETLKRWILLGSTIDENDQIIKRLSDMGFVLGHYLVESDLVREGCRNIQVAFGKPDDLYEGCFEHKPLQVLMKESPFVFDVIDLDYVD